MVVFEPRPTEHKWNRVNRVNIYNLSRTDYLQMSAGHRRNVTDIPKDKLSGSSSSSLFCLCSKLREIVKFSNRGGAQGKHGTNLTNWDLKPSSPLLWKQGDWAEVEEKTQLRWSHIEFWAISDWAQWQFFFCASDNVDPLGCLETRLLGISSVVSDWDWKV